MGQSLQIIGNRIRKYRKFKKLSQEQLAEMAGTHYSYIGKIERGEHNPTIQTLEKISEALEIDLAALFPANDFKDTEITDEVREAAALISEQTKDNQCKAVEILKIIYRKSKN
jgi:XRE family transcriptional regulator, regulator of sulfur utilization